MGGVIFLQQALFLHKFSRLSKLMLSFKVGRGYHQETEEIALQFKYV